MYRRNREITLREVIIAILILGLVITVGFFISDSIYDSTNSHNEKYYKALKVDNDKDMFAYVLDTEVGGLLSYGKVNTVDPVELDGLKGNYYAIERDTERYTQHTRTESYKCGKNTCHRTVTYWTWDLIDTNNYQAKEFKYLGKTFKSSIVDLKNNRYHSQQSAGFHLRYKYYTTPAKFEGSMFSVAKDKTIKQNEFYHNIKIKDLIEKKKGQADTYVLIFWVFWVIFGIALGVGFTLLDNKYLNGR